jgi:putative heme-binding domain-containing protein
MIGILESGGIQKKSDAMELMKLIAELGQPAQQQKLLGWIIDTKASTKLPALDVNENASILRALMDMSKRRKQPVALNPELLAALTSLLKSAKTDSPLSLLAIEALGQWQSNESRPLIESLIESGPTEIRFSAIKALASFGDDAARKAMAKLAVDGDAGIANLAIEQLVDLDLKLACQTVAERLAKLTDADASLTKALQSILAKKSGGDELAAKLNGKKLTINVGRSVRSILRSSGNASNELLQTIDRVASLNENRWVWSESLRDEWLALARTKGDAARGEMIYRRAELQCSQCHKVAGVGGVVGPELSSIGANAPADYLIEALIAPAAKVKEGYHAKLIRTDDDEVITGIPIRESDTEVVVRAADGKERTILKDQIEDSKDSRSLMPDGLLDSLSLEEAIDLVRFMTELGRIDGSMQIASDGTIRAWRALVWTQPAHHIFNRTSLDAVAGEQSSFTWQPIASLVNGSLPLNGLGKFQPHADTPPTTFLHTQIEVAREGTVQLDLGKQAKQSMSLWVDGVPTPITDSTISFPVRVGTCHVHIGVNRNVEDASIHVRLDAEKSTAKVTIN